MLNRPLRTENFANSSMSNQFDIQRSNSLENVDGVQSEKFGKMSEF